MTAEQNKLAEDNIGIARWAADKLYKRYKSELRHLNIAFDDFLGVAYYALCIAAINFKEELGFKFSTYAYQCISTQTARYVQQYNSVITLPIISDGLSGLDKRSRYTEQDKAMFLSLYQGTPNAYIRLNETVGDDGDTLLYDILGEDENVEGEYGYVEIMSIAEDVLNDKEFDLFVKHCVLGLGARELSECSGISYAAAWARCDRAKEKLRKVLS